MFIGDRGCIGPVRFVQNPPYVLEADRGKLTHRWSVRVSNACSQRRNLASVRVVYQAAMFETLMLMV